MAVQSRDQATLLVGGHSAGLQRPHSLVRKTGQGTGQGTREGSPLGSLGGRRKGSEGKGGKDIPGKEATEERLEAASAMGPGRWTLARSGGARSPLSPEEEGAAEGHEAHTAPGLFTTVSKSPQWCRPLGK